MAIEILILAAAIGAGDGCCAQPCCARIGSQGVYSSLASARPEIALNGREWVGLRIVNQENVRADQRDHAAASYGAAGDSNQSANVVVDGLFAFEGGVRVTINPWEAVGPERGTNNTTDPFRNARRKAAQRVEQARLEWLKDNGYVGGVRTFSSDSPAPAPRADEIKPRGVIELSPEVTQFRSRMQVNAQPVGPTRVSRQRAVIRVLPAGAAVADANAVDAAKPTNPISTAQELPDARAGA